MWDVHDVDSFRSVIFPCFDLNGFTVTEWWTIKCRHANCWKHVFSKNILTKQDFLNIEILVKRNQTLGSIGLIGELIRTCYDDSEILNHFKFVCEHYKITKDDINESFYKMSDFVYNIGHTKNKETIKFILTYFNITRNDLPMCCPIQWENFLCRTFPKFKDYLNNADIDRQDDLDYLNYLD